MWRHLWLAPNVFRCRCLCTCLPHFCSTWNCYLCNSLAILDQAFIVGQAHVQLLFKPGQDRHRQRSVRSRAAIRHCNDARNVTQMAESFKVMKIKACPPLRAKREQGSKFNWMKNLLGVKEFVWLPVCDVTFDKNHTIFDSSQSSPQILF